MPVIARLRSFWMNLSRRRRVDGDLDAELAAYLELAADQKAQAGLGAAAAQRAARLEMGGVEQVKEQVRAARAGAWLDTLWLDLRYGARALWRSPSFTVVAALALALGIGANSAIFSIVDGVLLRPLPYPGADRLVLVSRHFARSNFPYGNLCVADYVDWRAANRAFEEPALVRVNRFGLTGAGEPEQVAGAAVTAGFFSALRVRPLLGRVFVDSEDGTAGKQPLAMIAESLWRRHFGGDPGVIGRAVHLDGDIATVVGVMPAGFHFPRADSEIWTNLRFAPPARRGPFFYRGLGRLRPGVTLAQAQAEVNAVAGRIELADPRLSHLSFPLLPLRDSLVGNVRPALLVLFAAVTLVLLIAAVNVANLLLARASAREREMAVRLGLGAGRGRLIRQLLTESCLLAVLGGAAGMALAAGGIELLRRWNPGDLPRIEEIHLDPVALGFTLAVSLVTGLLFGLAPALQSSRRGLVGALKDGGRGGSASRARRRTGGALVVVEIALSLMLLAGAALFLRSFAALQSVKTGLAVPPSRVISLGIVPNPARLRDDAAVVTFYQGLLERVRQIPGVESAAISDSLPPDREGDADTYMVAGQPLGPGETNPIVSAPTVSAGYFATLGMPLLKGRLFDARERADSQPVVILSEGLARRQFPGRDPIGQRLKRSGPDIPGSPYMEIVGVVGNTMYLGLDNPLDAAYYTPAPQNPGLRQFLVVRSAAPAAALAPALRRAVEAIDPETVITSVVTLEQALSDSVARPRFRTALLAGFAAVALVLAAIGIYGIIAYSVVQRRHEIGVRMALGARRAEVLRLIVGEGALLAGLGIALGLAGALALARLLGNLLFGISAADPISFLAVPVLLAAVALAASFLPARRAAQIDPQVALRVD